MRAMHTGLLRRSVLGERRRVIDEMFLHWPEVVHSSRSYSFSTQYRSRGWPPSGSGNSATIVTPELLGDREETVPNAPSDPSPRTLHLYPGSRTAGSFVDLDGFDANVTFIGAQQ